MKIFTIVCCVLCFVLSNSALALNNGVILVYHHVSTQTPASTSVSPQQLREHLQYLKEHHQVLSLKELVGAVRKGQSLPDKAVAITFDDGYQDILENGHPILLEFGFPYTIFISPPLIGVQSDQLTWQQIKHMSQQGVTFANHTSEHDHLLIRREGESQQQWLNRVMLDIESAQRVLEDKLGIEHKYLAYPYGEYNQQLSQALLDRGYIGFAQHSGPISSQSDFGALPRFASAGIYANLKSLKVKLASLAMPIKQMKISDPELTHANRQPTQVLELDNQDFYMSQVGCFLNGQALSIEKQDNKLTLPLPDPLSAGRSRINCTAPSKSHRGRYYWYSQPWFVPDENGQYTN